MRVLGIDPGLTRCGIGIVDVAPDRRATLVYVGVVQTPPDAPLAERLLAVSQGIRLVLAEYAPTAMAVERVFAQHNLRTVMGTAQASGIALALGAEHGLAVGLHTPSEVKAAITGYGAADKAQVRRHGRARAGAGCGAEARGCRRRAGAGDLPCVAGWWSRYARLGRALDHRCAHAGAAGVARRREVTRQT